MRLELFDYELPPERIAQTPIEPRDASRLLVLHANGSREHRRFLELPSLLSAGDLLVFNDTRVLPARLFGRKETGANVEALLLQRQSAGRWVALVYPGRRLQEGARILFGDGALTAEVVGRGEEGTRVLQFEAPGAPAEQQGERTDELIHQLGQVPLPPYIHERLDDPERYQTIYAREEGSAAAPTAGLHFTPRVFEALRERGVGFAYVTLHVGIATFRPVKVDVIAEHEMHSEWYSVSPEAAKAINECTGRVVAVGTTTVRALESASRGPGAGGRGPGVQGSGFRVQGSEGGRGPGAGVRKDEGGRMKDEPRSEAAFSNSGSGDGDVSNSNSNSNSALGAGGWGPGAGESGFRVQMRLGAGEEGPGTGASGNVQANAESGYSPQGWGAGGASDGEQGRRVEAGSGLTRLYVTPGYRFRAVDALLTNFHMPKSSLMILVSSLAGVERIREAYRDALAGGYRFLSFGDAMFIEAAPGTRTADPE